ncbi:MAG: hypothetical protein L0387_20725 [Acidobacteria bacterium]|nr:hypothetical protein [Acidobacteriota bacterium]
MKEFGLKLCLFLFLAALFSGRTNELGALTGAITGTILLWPIYRKLLPAPVPRPQRKVLVEEDPVEAVAE